MLQVWSKRTFGQELLEQGKRTGGCSNTQSREHPRQPVSAHTTTHAHIPTLTRSTCANRVAHTHGTLNNQKILMLLDSGASCSVASKSCIPDKHIEPIQSTRLINADGRDMTPCGLATMTVGLGQFSTNHKFVVVNHLSTPVILGCDFCLTMGMC